MNGTTDPSTTARSRRPVRADAQRNIDTLLRAALAVFDASGVDAPIREIAQAAGVGIATIYRHFPRRSDLIVAVLRNQIDGCADAAVELAARHDAMEALVLWVDYYVGFVTARRGFAASLNSDDPAFEALAPYFLQRLGPVVQQLLGAAVAGGEIRKDVQPAELLCAVAALCAPVDYPELLNSRRLVSLFLDGLRYGSDRQR